MAIIDRSDKFYTDVEKWTQEVQYQVPASGVTWRVDQFHAVANPHQDTSAALIWDHGSENEEILALYYGTGDRHIGTTITGDGVKKLAIVLNNDSGSTELLGAEYTALEK